MTESDFEVVGPRIKQARLAVGLDQDALAGLVGVSSKTIRSWEKNQSHPTPSNFQSLSVALKRPVFWFYGQPGGEEQLWSMIEQLDARLSELERKVLNDGESPHR